MNLGNLTHTCMIKSIIKQWIFINYCGQKLGQFKGTDIKGTLLNVTTANIAVIVYGVILTIYALLGFRNVVCFLLIAIAFEFLVIRKFTKMYILSIMSLDELERRYKETLRWKRVLFFILALLIFITSYGIFFILLFSIKYFK